MTNLPRIFACILLCAFVCVCCNEVTPALKEAESIIQAHPDSALSMIQAIDTTKLYSAKLKAKYSLLKTMALDKNYVDVADFSVLQPAIDFYSRYGNNHNKALVNYYSGIIHYHKKDYESAIISFYEALKYAQRTDDPWIKGMICSLLCWTYNKNHNNAEELHYSEQAYTYFSDYGDSLYIQNAIYSKAIALHNNRFFQESDSLFALIPQHSKYYYPSLVYRADNEIKRPDRDAAKARALFETAYKNGERLSVTQYYLYAYSLLLTGDRNYADRILAGLSSFPKNADSEWWLYLIRKGEGRSEDAFLHLESYIYQQDSVVKAKLAQSLYKAESEHQLLVAEQATRQRNLWIALFSAIGVSALLVLLIGAVVSQQRKIKKQREYNELLQKYADTQRLIDELKAGSEKSSQLLASYISIYRRQFLRVGAIHNKDLDYYIPLDNTLEHFPDEGRIILGNLSDDSWQEELEKRLDKDLNGVMQKLRLDFPELDKTSLTLLMFIILGIKDRITASVFKENHGTIRSRKSRLKKMVLSVETANKDLYKAVFI